MNFRISLALIALIVSCPVLAQNYEEGRNAANRGDFTLAYQIWAPLAESGNGDAAFGLGRMYARGDGVPQDFTKARELFTKAAEQGNLRAKTALGKQYEFGDGVAKDLEQARKWFSEAAAAGEAEAVTHLQALPEVQAPAPMPAVSAEMADNNFIDPDSGFVPPSRPIPREIEVPKVSKQTVPSANNRFNAPQSSQITSVSNSTASTVNREPLSEGAMMFMAGLAALLIIMVINGIRLGLSDKMIFYDSGMDLLATLLIWILPALLSFPVMMLVMPEHGSAQAATQDNMWYFLIPIGVGLLAAVLTFTKSLKHNGLSFGSICVAV